MTQTAQALIKGRRALEWTARLPQRKPVPMADLPSQSPACLADYDRNLQRPFCYAPLLPEWPCTYSSVDPHQEKAFCPLHSRTNAVRKSPVGVHWGDEAPI